MTAQRVWAPAASTVELVVGDVRTPMTSRDGWWSGRAVEAGADYGFSVDGGPVRPDPRSVWLPHGVHGPSRSVDHSAFRHDPHYIAGVDVFERRRQLHVASIR